VRGDVVNRIVVDDTVARNARTALDRMLALPEIVPALKD
jgi:quinolinate synthase